MKPTKNRYYCVGCHHHKMLFKTKDEAIRFIQYNADCIENETGKRPVRAYYCYDCGGWHVTSSRFSQNRMSILQRFGEERGLEIFSKIMTIRGKCRNIEEGLLHHIKELRHLLKFNQIDVERCYNKIQRLIDDFEVVMSYQFGEQANVERLFEKFNDLCDIYLRKSQVCPQIA